MPAAARWFLMEFGLLLFMAGVGLRAGQDIVETFLTAGPTLIAAGIVVTTVPVLVGYTFGRKVLSIEPVLLFGAVTGAMMALGLKYGGTKPGDKEKAYELVREFIDRFQARHGTLKCKDLLGCDLSTPERRAHFKEHKLHDTVCTQFVRDAVEIAEELME